MSWMISVESAVRPRSFQHDVGEKLDAAQKVEIDQLHKQGAFRSEEHEERVGQQMSIGIAAARRILSSTHVEYPTGCKIYVTCEGHLGSNDLNFEPHHVSVRVNVVPVPFRR